MISSLFSAVGVSTQGTTSTFSSWKTAQDGCERRLLILGSRYSGSPVQRMRTPYESRLQSLKGVVGDTNDLRSAFQRRGYSVETLVEEEFNRQTALDRVAEFLRPAVAGDVRAIIFTGHATEDGDIIPPICGIGTSQDLIPPSVWTENIQNNVKPGVIVLSIFASCFSGNLMKQSVKLTDFGCPARTPSVFDAPDASPDSHVAPSETPIFITFNSSKENERSHESEDPLSEDRTSDHFLSALATTARDTEIKDWSDFIKTLQVAFCLARSLGATGSNDPVKWLIENPQHPGATMSRAAPPVRSVLLLLLFKPLTIIIRTRAFKMCSHNQSKSRNPCPHVTCFFLLNLFFVPTYTMSSMIFILYNTLQSAYFGSPINKQSTSFNNFL